MHYRLPPVPVRANQSGEAIKAASGHAMKQPAVQAPAPFSPRVVAGNHSALPRPGSRTGGGGDALAMTHYGAKCASDDPHHPTGCTVGAHSTLSTHSDSGIYSRRSLLDSAISLPSMPGVGY